MLNNDVMRSIRFMLKINSGKMAEICRLTGLAVTRAQMYDFLRNEEDPEYKECPDEVMAKFLDGMIYFKRGKDESRPPPPLELPVTVNLVLKKLKVAFQLREEEMLAMIESTGFEFGKSELSAVLRKNDHRNYRLCGEQVLRYFLRGLIVREHGG